MPRLLNLLAVASVSLALPASAHHIADDQRIAHHVADDQRVAEATPHEKLVGTYSIHLDEAAKTKLQKTRETAAAATTESEKRIAKVMLEMAEAMTSITVTFTKTELTLAIPGETDKMTYTVVRSAPEGLKLKATGGKGGDATFDVTFREGGITMTQEGEDQAFTFDKK